MAERLMGVETFKNYIRNHGYCEDCECVIQYPECLDLCGLGGLFALIDEAPTIEAKPVVHAHWKEYWDYDCMDYSYGCSNCGKDALTKEGTMYNQVLTEYCPYCGAQMDEVAE